MNALLLCFGLCLVIASGNALAGDKAIAAGDQAPTFTSRNQAGKTWSLADLRGKPVALFFYCGCESCRQCALEWARTQRSGVLAARPFKAPALPVTVVVNTTDAEGIGLFAKRTGLASGTVLLPDSDERLSRLYGVSPCPRVFVLDAKGTLRYTNNSEDDAPQEATERIICARTLAALRTASGSEAPVIRRAE
jgi:peroxiredoxin